MKTESGDLWEQVNNEKKKDKRVRLVSIAAWSITGLAIGFYGVIIVHRFIIHQQLVQSGMMPAGQEWAAFIPLVAVIGVVALFVATLATVGMFLRLRTTSLEELKVRLGALEQLVVEHIDAK